MKIGFLTASHLPNLTADDRLVIPYLATAGIEVVPVVWTEAMPAGLHALIMRSTWAYYQQASAFRDWLSSLALLDLPIWNPPATLLANLDKRYLLDLHNHGWPIVPTEVLAPGEASHYAHCLQARDWHDVIVKPAVSASGHETHRLPSTATLPASLCALNQCTALLVQPFCQSIQTEGEWSLMFLGGQFSHAVNKRPGPNQHLVQEDYGGQTRAAAPPPDLLQLAQRLFAAECGDCLYARLDFVRVDDSYALMELELLEPSLYLAQEPGAAARWAGAVATALAQILVDNPASGQPRP
ncbi:MAG: hypothetical protein CVV27_02860 [Candidatus Melainabacteria bacterium HGW-Melainabacteria-1]|nr:MAG: hypothetical protein CVV27_02860 [Candidatus Melainabacteria bacterium HGW-Melainabacteria-1]